MHSIFGRKYQYWWLGLALFISIKFYLFGVPEYTNLGFVGSVVGVMFSGLVFGSIFYLLYRLMWRKWNNDVFIVLITITAVMTALV